MVSVRVGSPVLTVNPAPLFRYRFRSRNEAVGKGLLDVVGCLLLVLRCVLWVLVAGLAVICSRVWAVMVAVVRASSTQKVWALWRSRLIWLVISPMVVLIRLRLSAMTFSRPGVMVLRCALAGGVSS